MAKRTQKQSRNPYSPPVIPKWMKAFLHPKIAGSIATILLIASGITWLINSDDGQAYLKEAELLGDNALYASGLTLKSVKISGIQRTPRKNILRLLPPANGKFALSGISLSRLSEQISHLPWVKDVQISRKWPDSMIITVQERTPLALWQKQRNLFLIDLDGEIIPIENLKPYKHFPHIIGAKANYQAAALLETLSHTQKVKKLLKSANYVESRRWNLNLTNGITVQLPQKNWENALESLEKLDKESQVLTKDIKFIDMRTPPQVILRLQEAPAKKNKNIRSPTLKKKPRAA